MTRRFKYLVVALLCYESVVAAAAVTTMTSDAEPNPPIWPDSVKIVRESDGTQAIMDTLQETQDSWNETAQSFTCDHHFSSQRWAILFEPGTYSGIDLEIGYYVQIAGLGTSPDHVQFVDC